MRQESVGKKSEGIVCRIERGRDGLMKDSQGWGLRRDGV